MPFSTFQDLFMYVCVIYGYFIPITYFKIFFFSRMRGRGDKRKKHGEVGKAELKRYRKTLSDRGFRPTADAPFVPMSQDVVDNFQRKQAAKNPDIPLPPEISHPVRVRHWGPKRRRVAVVPENDYVVEEPAADVQQDVHDVRVDDEEPHKDDIRDVPEMPYPLHNADTLFADNHHTNDPNLKTDRKLFQELLYTTDWKYPLRPTMLENLRNYKIDSSLTESDLMSLRDILVQSSIMEMGRITSLFERAAERKMKFCTDLKMEYDKLKAKKPNKMEEMIEELQNQYTGLSMAEDEKYLNTQHLDTISLNGKTSKSIMLPETDWIKILHANTTKKNLKVGSKGHAKEYEYIVFPDKG